MTSRRGPEIPSILVVVSVYTGIEDVLVHGDRRGVFSSGRSVCFFEDDFCFCIFFRLGDCMNRQKWAACIVLFNSSVRLYFLQSSSLFFETFLKTITQPFIVFPFRFLPRGVLRWSTKCFTTRCSNEWISPVVFGIRGVHLASDSMRLRCAWLNSRLPDVPDISVIPDSLFRSVSTRMPARMDSLHDHRVNGTSTNVGRHWTSTYLDNQTEENMTVLKSQVSLYACIPSS